MMVLRVRNPRHENKLCAWQDLIARKVCSVVRNVVLCLRDFRLPPRRLCISCRRCRVTRRSKKNSFWTAWPMHMGLIGYQEMSLTTNLCYVLTEKREDSLCSVTVRVNYITYLFCTLTNKCTIFSQIITLLHVSTLSCHPQGANNQCLVKLDTYFKNMPFRGPCIMIYSYNKTNEMH